MVYTTCFIENTSKFGIFNIKILLLLLASLNGASMLGTEF